MDEEEKKIESALGPINAQLFTDIRAEAEALLSIPKASRGRGKKKKGTTRDARLKAALDLVARCGDAMVPPPVALIQLLSDAVGSAPDVIPTDRREPNLTPDQWKAVDVLFKSPSLRLNWEDDELPIKLSSRQIKDLVGISHVTILEWWKNPEFRRGLIWRISEKLEKNLEKKAPLNQ